MIDETRRMRSVAGCTLQWPAAQPVDGECCGYFDQATWTAAEVPLPENSGMNVPIDEGV